MQGDVRAPVRRPWEQPSPTPPATPAADALLDVVPPASGAPQLQPVRPASGSLFGGGGLTGAGEYRRRYGAGAMTQGALTFRGDGTNDALMYFNKMVVAGPTFDGAHAPSVLRKQRM